MPSELQRFRIWLQQQGVEEAVMESTAQYWRSVWLELEPHMRLHLAQAFSNRAPRGRKHDFKDAERLVRRLIVMACSIKGNVKRNTSPSTGSWEKFLTSSSRYDHG